jgi:hypothetical protein
MQPSLTPCATVEIGDDSLASRVPAHEISTEPGAGEARSADDGSRPVFQARMLHVAG